MKKIGILTFHKVYSYGATLQCFALFFFLKKNNYEVKIIDYSINAYLELRKSDLLSRLIRFFRKACKPELIKRKFNAIFIDVRKKTKISLLKRRNEKFEIFWDKHFHLTENSYQKYTQLKQSPPVFDAYICGSDQIWNPRFCDMDDNYYLEFAPCRKRIAYAPSFGVSSLPLEKEEIYKERLQKIQYLSIREKSGSQIIFKLLGKNVPVVIDPTFLLEPKDWNEIADESKISLPSKYILNYFIGIDSKMKQYIRMVESKFPNYKVVNLVFDETCYGPCDFLKMIKNASFVFTNSFHGLALSINMNVPFAVAKTLKDSVKGNGFARIDNLLKIFNLESRVFDGSVDFDEKWFLIDYSEVNRIKKKWIDESKKFLCESIESCGK